MRKTSKFRFVFTWASTYSPNVVFCCWWGGRPTPKLAICCVGEFPSKLLCKLRGAGGDQGAFCRGQPPLLPMPQWSWGGVAKRTKRNPNKANPGRILKRVPGFTYLLVLPGCLLYLPIFLCTAPSGCATAGGVGQHAQVCRIQYNCA